ncbi:MAG: FGGY family carbohydrate kinase [Anaerolineales bacterium]
MSKKKSRFVLGSDLGTSGCKSIVLDIEGQIRGWALEDYPTLRLHPGWAEQEPEDWFAAFCKTVRQAIKQAGIKPENIEVVCIVGITHNAILLDERDAVLRPSIIYTDTRSEEQAQALLERWGEQVFLRTNNGISPIWTWPQLLWIRENEQQIWSRIHRILFPKDFIRHQIAPSFIIDTIDPVGTLLYDPIENNWIEEFVTDLELPQHALPKSVGPFQVVGKISPVGENASGLKAGTPVIAGTTDTAAETFGVGALRPGQAYIKLATVGRIASVSSNPLLAPGILNYPHVIEGLWYPGTSTKFGASAFTWAREAFWTDNEMPADYKLMDRTAAMVPPGCDGMLFHPYLTGEFAPLWDPRLRASFLGVGLQHNRPHFTRAVMEGVGYAIRDALENVIKAGLQVDEIRLIGGGSASKLWAQIICDILQRDVIVPEGTDAAYGAALMAGVAAGIYEKEPEFINNLIRVRDRYFPDKERVELYEELFNIFKLASKATEEVSHLLYEFQTLQSKLKR